MIEILQIQIGNCGNLIGNSFWKVISEQHGISNNGIYKGFSDSQLENISVYFDETKDHHFLARSILVDLGSDSFGQIKSSSYSQLFNPNFMISSNESSDKNYSKAVKIYSSQLDTLIINNIRKEVETCDQLQGIQIIYGLGGGTG